MHCDHSLAQLRGPQKLLKKLPCSLSFVNETQLWPFPPPMMQGGHRPCLMEGGEPLAPAHVSRSLSIAFATFPFPADQAPWNSSGIHLLQV